MISLLKFTELQYEFSNQLYIDRGKKRETEIIDWCLPEDNLRFFFQNFKNSCCDLLNWMQIPFHASTSETVINVKYF